MIIILLGNFLPLEIIEQIIKKMNYEEVISADFDIGYGALKKYVIASQY
jgi:hypothetical protein